ncbi:MAG: hypothetical protein JWQ35_2409, partial [Bacteriovoracaceae bacterium]|nr:hypothetical protein [Bacteriovoracaceae bacterium]
MDLAHLMTVPKFRMLTRLKRSFSGCLFVFLLFAVQAQANGICDRLIADLRLRSLSISKEIDLRSPEYVRQSLFSRASIAPKIEGHRMSFRIFSSETLIDRAEKNKLEHRVELVML